MKTKNTTRKRIGSDDLLLIADRVNAIARRAEHLVITFYKFTFWITRTRNKCSSAIASFAYYEFATT